MAGTYLAAALISYDPSQVTFRSTSPVLKNWVGWFGADTVWVLLYSIGASTIPLPFALLLDVLRRDPQLAPLGGDTHHGNRGRDRVGVGAAGHVRELQGERHLPEGVGRMDRPADLPEAACGGAGAVRHGPPSGGGLLLCAPVRRHEGHRLRAREDADKLLGVEGGPREGQGRDRGGEGQAQGGAGQAEGRAGAAPLPEIARRSTSGRSARRRSSRPSPPTTPWRGRSPASRPPAAGHGAEGRDPAAHRPQGAAGREDRAQDRQARGAEEGQGHAPADLRRELRVSAAQAPQGAGEAARREAATRSTSTTRRPCCGSWASSASR